MACDDACRHFSTEIVSNALTNDIAMSKSKLLNSIGQSIVSLAKPLVEDSLSLHVLTKFIVVIFLAENMRGG